MKEGLFNWLEEQKEVKEIFPERGNDIVLLENSTTVEKALKIKQKIEQEGGYPIFDFNSYSFIIEESPLFLRS
jgi:hypothetical protein